ncbi:amino acid ABC transporter permease [Christensenellaceae bacterium OttesenSCG-928-L17]|nr:amino acid ABC transporter permease [Christensenellaceae bacterium OttesenSCG-928-L17]
MAEFFTQLWQNFLNSGIVRQFYRNVIQDDRYMLYLEGLKNTLLLTFGAAVIGVVIGTLVGMCKVAARNNKLLRPLEILCDIYLTVIRGTPAMVQVMIFGLVIFRFVSMDRMLLVATLALGINSGAYVAEIIRAGVQAVDIGQTEAGRSLGLTGGMTMRFIVLPQAIKNILPALANEAIMLLKETAIVSVLAVRDLTYSSTLVRSRTYDTMPLIVITVMYLGMVMLMTFGLRKLEGRLAKSDKRD